MDRGTLDPCLRIGETAQGCVGDQDVVAGLSGRFFNARGRIDGITDDRELHATTTADRADDHRAGVDPHTDPQLAAVRRIDRVDDVAARGDGAIRVILEAVGRTEDGK